MGRTVDFPVPFITRPVYGQDRSFADIAGLFYIHGVHRLGIKKFAFALDGADLEPLQQIVEMLEAQAVAFFHGIYSAD